MHQLFYCLFIAHKKPNFPRPKNAASALRLRQTVMAQQMFEVLTEIQQQQK